MSGDSKDLVKKYKRQIWDLTKEMESNVLESGAVIPFILHPKYSEYLQARVNLYDAMAEVEYDKGNSKGWHRLTNLRDEAWDRLQKLKVGLI